MLGGVEVRGSQRAEGTRWHQLLFLLLLLGQEAFFGKALMDLSRKALLAAGGVGDGAARPSLGQGAPRHKGDPSVAGALQGAPPDRRDPPTHPRGEQGAAGVPALVAGMLLGGDHWGTGTRCGHWGGVGGQRGVGRGALGRDRGTTRCGSGGSKGVRGHRGGCPPS